MIKEYSFLGIRGNFGKTERSAVYGRTFANIRSKIAL